MLALSFIDTVHIALILNFSSSKEVNKQRLCSFITHFYSVKCVFVVKASISWNTSVCSA